MPDKSLAIRFVMLTLPGILFGCVELQGQRISIYHDEERDRLLLLLHYEGIHDSGSNKHGNGIEQIRQGVQNEEFLILDWPLHFERDEIAAIANDVDKSLVQRRLARSFVDQITAIPLGTYRDINGHIGAVQAIEIAHIADLVSTANRVIQEHAATNDEEDEADVSPTSDPRNRRTTDRATRIRLQGHSVIIHAWFDAVDKGELADWQEMIRNAPQPSPLSIQHEGEWLIATVGLEKTPSTIRFTNLRDYDASLEGILEETVPKNLDRKLSPILLENSIKLEESEASLLQRLVKWGAPEENVRVVLAVARDKKDERRNEAFTWLENWGSAIDEEGALPPPPELTGDRVAYLDEWEEWYRNIFRFVLR